MLDRAYSILNVKEMSNDAEFFYIKGIASTPEADKMQDIVEPMGAEFTTPMPLLLQHNHNLPVGHVTFAKPTKTGIPFDAQIPYIKEEGMLKQRVDEAIQSVKYGLISAVSIGFQAIAGHTERLESGGLRFKRWRWHELSLVTIPANSGAVITAIKAFDQERLAQEGITGVEEVVSEPAKGPIPTAKRGPVKLLPRTYSK
jgi:HK97 family phage prohead protease